MALIGQNNAILMGSPLFQNDAVSFGILMFLLWAIFSTAKSTHPWLQKFYRIVPALFLCYFLPSLMVWPLNLISPEGSSLYFVASRYLLPAAIVLLCINIDFQEIRKLGSKAIWMFLTATGSIILGGPFAILLATMLFPDLLEISNEDLWRGLSTVAGSWIGGGANQTAMKEIFEVEDDLFGNMLVVDIVMANVLLAVLFFMLNYRERINQWLRADDSSILDLQKKMETYEATISRKPEVYDYIKISGIAFFCVAVSHALADVIAPFLEQHGEVIKKWNLHSLLSPFFWLIVVATTLGILLSWTPLRKIEGAGSGKIATVFIYILVAAIGMKMNISEIFKYPELFLLGFFWILFHLAVLFLVAKLIRAPFFFIAVGSQANVGGAASAPIMASAFHSSLAPVGVLLAVLGYALGTYGAILCALLMQTVVGGS